MSEKQKNEDTSIISSTEKDSRFGCYIAISPDGQQIVTFNPEECELKLYNIANLSDPISTFQYDKIFYDERYCYSLAISNCINNENERLIALSRFDAKEMLHKIYKTLDHYDDENKSLLFDQNESPNHNDDENNSIESGEVKSQSRTWVISTTKKSQIHTSLELIGGVVRFLDSDVGSQPLINKTVIIIVNESGIYKKTLINDKIKKEQDFQKQYRFFGLPITNIKFELPQQLSTSLSILSREQIHSPLDLGHSQKTIELLQTSIIKNHFMVHSFKNRHQIIEMYNLITGDLEMLFKSHESSAAPDTIRGSPIFAISQNERILAFCRGTISITLYLMDNGLEITTIKIGKIDKILAINFIDNDSKLLIVLEEKQESEIKQIFVVCDLFTTFKDSIRQISYSDASLKMDFTRQSINSHGMILGVTDNKNIISVLENQDVASILNPPSNKMTEVNIKVENDHTIYDIGGNASELTENQIIRNVEPWNSKKDSRRLSVWLDFTKRTQLIISHNTIQIWKYCNKKNKVEKLDQHDKVLEYIWASKNGLEVQELKVREREFVLKLLIPSTKSSAGKRMTIHWPSNANVLEGACRTLNVLEEKRYFVTGHNNTQQFEYLIECTQRLVRKYITKYGIFRLTNIRYPIMKHLIKGHQESLIKQILSTKINEKNNFNHIPKLYKWAVRGKDNDESVRGKDNDESVREKDNDESVRGKDKDKLPELKLKSKSDLHHAILCTRRRVDSTAILEYLIDYYTDNAKKYNNDGWMSTVSEAIPLLYDCGLGEFAKDLFKKPCFGITEAYTPPLHITRINQHEGNNTSVICSLDVKPCLTLPPSMINKLWYFIKKQFIRFDPPHNDRKVYTVPLPDFTIYPKKGLEDQSENLPKSFWFLRLFFWPRRKMIKDTNQMSPFLRVIHEEKGVEIHQTPAIMAVLDFKWKAAHDDSLVVPTYKINDTSNPDIYSNITIYQDVDKSSRLDNYYSDILSSIIAVFFWTNGRWDQLNQWDSFAVIAMSILGSIILVLIFQNMLIAFMNGAFEEAHKVNHTEAYRYRVDLVAEYEALEKFFHNKSENPRYIYYIPNPKVIDTWIMENEEKQKLHPDSDYSGDDDDFDDDDDSSDSSDYDQDNSSNSKKDRIDVMFTDGESFGSNVTSKSNKKPDLKTILKILAHKAINKTASKKNDGWCWRKQELRMARISRKVNLASS
ncbi:hypothetical protein Glove_707g10 [Diversispora epigaea]|uniref:Ion transport domain-containing protein n=1 Tax=Diversispora epigaea TaxID=1348612 RepID=A0A397G1Q5_9GLOM|nr:hypothetical protein Glove_707g10 [Diversispora epigaea]